MAQKFMKNKLIYLNRLANIISDDNLKPFYRARLNKLEAESNIEIDLKQNRKKWCPQCLMDYKKTPPMILIKPPKNLKCSDKKIIKKKTLTQAERKYKKYINRIQSQKLVSHCKSCGLILRKDIEKPKIIKSATEMPPKLIKSSKKRKRDRCSGLNYEAVLSAMKLANTGDVTIQKKVRMKNTTNVNKVKEEKKLNTAINKKKLKKISDALGVGVGVGAPKSKGLKQFLSAMKM